MNPAQTRACPLISFAIPTYNFGKFIGETIRSIEDGAQVFAQSEFELVILDGGSNDDTSEVVGALQSEYANIKYIQQGYRGGIDRDLDSVISECRGRYIWIFSADDLLSSGWDGCLKPLLDADEELVLIPALLCDLNMQVLRPNPIFRECDNQEIVRFSFGRTGGLTHYLERAVTLEALFSYMSAIVVRANVWKNLPAKEDYFGTCWAHCARLMPLMFRDSTIVYLNTYLIKKRGENDSFMTNGFVARIALAVDGWDRIFNEYFFNSQDLMLLYGALRHDMPVALFLYAKIDAPIKEMARLQELAKRLYVKRSPTFGTLVSFALFVAFPRSVAIRALIKPCLPFLKRVRHRIKSILA